MADTVEIAMSDKTIECIVYDKTWNVYWACGISSTRLMSSFEPFIAANSVIVTPTLSKYEL